MNSFKNVLLYDAYQSKNPDFNYQQYDPFNLDNIDGRDTVHNPDRSDREKWSTSKGGPVFSKLFQLDRTDPLSFGPKFPEILVETGSRPIPPNAQVAQA